MMLRRDLGGNLFEKKEKKKNKKRYTHGKDHWIAS